MEYPKLSYVLFTTLDRPHSDNGVGAQGTDLLVKISAEDRWVFLWKFNLRKED